MPTAKYRWFVRTILSSLFNSALEFHLSATTYLEGLNEGRFSIRFTWPKHQEWTEKHFSHVTENSLHLEKHLRGVRKAYLGLLPNGTVTHMGPEKHVRSVDSEWYRKPSQEHFIWNLLHRN